MYECYDLLAKCYALTSRIFNIDTTNWTMTSPVQRGGRGGCDRTGKMRSCKGWSQREVGVTLLSMTDGNGVIRYERPYDGATTDTILLSYIDQIVSNIRSD